MDISRVAVLNLSLYVSSVDSFQLLYKIYFSRCRIIHRQYLKTLRVNTTQDEVEDRVSVGLIYGHMIIELVVATWLFQRSYARRPLGDMVTGLMTTPWCIGQV